MVATASEFSQNLSTAKFGLFKPPEQQPADAIAKMAIVLASKMSVFFFVTFMKSNPTGWRSKKIESTYQLFTGLSETFFHLGYGFDSQSPKTLRNQIIGIVGIVSCLNSVKERDPSLGKPGDVRDVASTSQRRQ